MTTAAPPPTLSPHPCLLSQRERGSSPLHTQLRGFCLQAITRPTSPTGSPPSQPSHIKGEGTGHPRDPSAALSMTTAAPPSSQHPHPCPLSQRERGTRPRTYPSALPRDLTVTLDASLRRHDGMGLRGSCQRRNDNGRIRRGCRGGRRRDRGGGRRSRRPARRLERRGGCSTAPTRSPPAPAGARTRAQA